MFFPETSSLLQEEVLLAKELFLFSSIRKCRMQNEDKREFSVFPQKEIRSDICHTASDIVHSHSDILKE